MVTNNKVLTVSYGTFSCTLEGFEESFDTMKAIAEYFRDLAGDDRYFGAEPPTPDAEMLARIAEREIERRVSARMDSGAIVLSAMPGAAAQAEEVKTPQSEETSIIAKDDASVVADSVKEPDASEDLDETDFDSEVAEEESAVQEDVVEAVEVEETLIETPVEAEDIEQAQADEADIEITDAVAAEIADDYADSVQDIEDVAEPVAEISETEEAVLDEAESLEDFVEVAEDETAFAIDAERADVAEETPLDAQQEDQIKDAAELFALADEENSEDSFFDDFPEALSEEDELQADNSAASEDFGFSDWEDQKDDVPPQFEENSIAAKLERIRAVVARVDAQPDEEDFSEDEHAEAVEPQDVSNEKTLERIEAAVAENVSEHEELEDAFSAEPIGEDVAQDELLDKTEDEVDTPAPLRARVVRMKKADFEQAVSSGLLEAEPVEDDEVEPESTETGLTAEDEADLMAELAEVEAELAPETLELEEDTSAQDAAFEADPIEDAAELAETEISVDDIDTGSQVLADQPSGDKDISRLMDKANTEMEEPEGNRRRRAIAHLRAAVAATRAEKEAGQDTGPKDGTTAYRDDLASVVRPVPGGNPVSQPKSERPAPAPLKLVAEQRIDTPVEEPEQPQEEAVPSAAVRPRRVSADQIDRVEVARAATPVGSNAAMQSDFVEFASDVGATRLPDTLEAAASYLTYDQGMDRFSRAMLVRLARECNEAEFTREDGLRSFGQLLRSGKIKKIAGGKFTADPSIGFRRDEGRAVG